MKIKPVTITLLLFALFLGYTCACMTVDKAFFTPQGVSGDARTYDTIEIGFSWLNLKGSNELEYNDTFYKLSKYLGYVAILTAASLSCLWLYKFIKTRSIIKIYPSLNAAVATFILTVIFYVAFEIIELNYRPVVLDGELEASYPSTHTLLGCVAFGCASLSCRHLVKDKALGRSLSALCYVLALVLVLFRTLSGVHWLSDIIGGLLLSVALLFFAEYAVSFQREKMNKKRVTAAE